MICFAGCRQWRPSIPCRNIATNSAVPRQADVTVKKSVCRSSPLFCESPVNSNGKCTPYSCLFCVYLSSGVAVRRPIKMTLFMLYPPFLQVFFCGFQQVIHCPIPWMTLALSIQHLFTFRSTPFFFANSPISESVLLGRLVRLFAGF